MGGKMGIEERVPYAFTEGTRNATHGTLWVRATPVTGLGARARNVRLDLR